jgi:hypothetical protein
MPAGQPLVAGGVVFITTTDRRVEGFSAECSTIPCPPRFEFRIGVDIVGTAASGDRVLTVLTDDGTIRAFAAARVDDGA